VVSSKVQQTLKITELNSGVCGCWKTLKRTIHKMLTTVHFECVEYVSYVEIINLEFHTQFGIIHYHF